MAYEKSDLSFRAVASVWAALAVVLVLVFLVSGWLIRRFTAGGTVIPHEPPASQIPPKPRLEVRAAAELAALQRQEDEILNGYAWEDRSPRRLATGRRKLGDRRRGVIRIPIERAMDLMAKRGGRK